MKLIKSIFLLITSLLLFSCGTPDEDEVFLGTAADGHCDWNNLEENPICRFEIKKIAGTSGNALLKIKENSFDNGKIAFTFNLTKSSSDSSYDFTSCEFYLASDGRPHACLKNYKNVLASNADAFDDFICLCGEKVTSEECLKCSAKVSVVDDIDLDSDSRKFISAGEYSFVLSFNMNPAANNKYTTGETVYNFNVYSLDEFNQSPSASIELKAEECEMLNQSSLKLSYSGIYFWIEESKTFSASWKLFDDAESFKVE